MNDRKDRNGAKVLFIEEIQSDWHQAGRKQGYKSNKNIKKEFDDFNAKIKKQVHDKYVAMYKEQYESEPLLRQALKNKPIDEFAEEAANTYEATNFKNLDDYASEVGKADEWFSLYEQLMTENDAILDAPFKDTKAWTGLALKRIISYAVENGYDKVAFINGTQSADRYDLSVHLDKIIYSKNDDGTYDIDAIKNDSSIFNRDSQTLENIEETFGKEIATKVKDGVDSSLTKEQAKEQNQVRCETHNYSKCSKANRGSDNGPDPIQLGTHNRHQGTAGHHADSE
jgi:hypothetical protein